MESCIIVLYTISYFHSKLEISQLVNLSVSVLQCGTNVTMGVEEKQFFGTFNESQNTTDKLNVLLIFKLLPLS